MSKSNAFEQAVLDLIFNNTPIANLGDVPGIQGSAAAGNLYLSLHTADPGEGADQTTSEIAYTGYARVAVARDAAELDNSSGRMEIVNDQDFGEMTAGAGGIVTHWGIGTSVSGVGMILYTGAVTPTIDVALGTIPRLKGQASGTPSYVTED